METKNVLVISSVGVPTPPTWPEDDPEGRKGIRYGGLELVAWQVAKGLAKDGHKVSMIASLDSDRSYYDPHGIEFIPTVKAGISVQGLGIPEDPSHLIWKERIKGRKYDVVIDQSHAHHSFMEQQRDPDYPPVIHVFHDDHAPGTHCDHEGRTTLPKTLESPRICGVSFSHAQRMNLSFGLTTCRAVHHGIDMAEYPLHTGVRNGRALVVNRVQWFKGIWEVIQVCDMAGIPLDIVGPADHIQGDPYVPFVKQFEDGDRVKFHGEVPQEKKIEMMQQATVGLSMPWHCEAFGLVAPEFQACGTPILVNRSGALPELVPPENSCRDMMRAARRVRQIVENDRYLPKDYRAIVERDFTLDHMLGRYRRLVDDALKGVSW